MPWKKAGTCSVCLQEFNNRNRATLETCGHAFCFGCILPWSQLRNTCPLCCKRFKGIRRSDGSIILVDKADNFVPDEPCMVCYHGKDTHVLLLCDNCDDAYHTYCLKPPLEKVPEGEWYCHKCRKLESVKEKIKKSKKNDSKETSGRTRTRTVARRRPRLLQRRQSVPVPRRNRDRRLSRVLSPSGSTSSLSLPKLAPRQHRCRFCHRIFKSARGLISHKNWCTYRTNASCIDCNSTFSNVRSLVRHKRSCQKQPPLDKNKTIHKGCTACHKPDNDHVMLVCESCDDSYHSYCLNPPLEKPPPKGTIWICDGCKDEEKKYLIEKDKVRSKYERNKSASSLTSDVIGDDCQKIWKRPKKRRKKERHPPESHSRKKKRVKMHDERLRGHVRLLRACQIVVENLENNNTWKFISGKYFPVGLSLLQRSIHLKKYKQFSSFRKDLAEAFEAAIESISQISTEDDSSSSKSDSVRKAPVDYEEELRQDQLNLLRMSIREYIYNASNYLKNDRSLHRKREKEGAASQKDVVSKVPFLPIPKRHNSISSSSATTEISDRCVEDHHKTVWEEEEANGKGAKEEVAMKVANHILAVTKFEEKNDRRPRVKKLKNSKGHPNASTPVTRNVTEHWWNNHSDWFKKSGAVPRTKNSVNLMVSRNKPQDLNLHGIYKGNKWWYNALSDRIVLGEECTEARKVEARYSEIHGLEGNEREYGLRRRWMERLENMILKPFHGSVEGQKVEANVPWGTETFVHETSNGEEGEIRLVNTRGCKRKKEIKLGYTKGLKSLGSLFANFDETPWVHIPDSARCFHCGKFAKRCCSLCYGTFYCSLQCQWHEWAEHSLICPQIPAVRREMFRRKQEQKMFVETVRQERESGQAGNFTGRYPNSMRTLMEEQMYVQQLTDDHFDQEMLDNSAHSQMGSKNKEEWRQGGPRGANDSWPARSSTGTSTTSMSYYNHDNQKTKDVLQHQLDKLRRLQHAPLIIEPTENKVETKPQTIQVASSNNLHTRTESKPVIDLKASAHGITESNMEMKVYIHDANTSLVEKTGRQSSPKTFGGRRSHVKMHPLVSVRNQQDFGECAAYQRNPLHAFHSSHPGPQFSPIVLSKVIPVSFVKRSCAPTF